jgi:hypothetical protein
MTVYVPEFFVNKGMWRALKKVKGGWYRLQKDLAKKGHKVAKNTLVASAIKPTPAIKGILYEAYSISYRDFDEVVKVEQITTDVSGVLDDGDA